jgi:hypothetical protein
VTAQPYRQSHQSKAMGIEKEELNLKHPPDSHDQGLAEVLAEEMPEAVEIPEASQRNPESPTRGLLARDPGLIKTRS